MHYEFLDLETDEEHSIFLGFNAHYVFADGFEHPLHGSAVWCYSCDSVSAAESFKIDRPKKEIWREHCLNIIAGRSNDWPYPGECPTRQEAALKLQTLETFWKQFENRTDPPRCLSCGGFNFTHLEISGINELNNGRRLECSGCFTSGFSKAVSVAFNGNGERVGQ